MTAPASVDEQLAERARKIARDQGGVPSQNRLKTELRVGVDKARAVLTLLQAEQSQRRSDRRRAMKGVASKASRNRPRVRSLGGSRPVLAVPTSPGVPALQPIVLPQVAPGDVPAGTTSVPVKAAGPGRVVTWPALLVAAPAFVAIWAGWVAIGKLTGFGKVNLLPGFGGGLVVDTAITLPVGVEVYSAFAFYVFLHTSAPRRARVFAAWSAGLAVVLGMGAQTAYHLLSAAGVTAAPWQITTFVSCLPVAVFAVTAVLVHLVRQGAGSQVKGDRR